jgi:capsular polysaccharide transport system ATP-binding protein
VLEVRNVHKIFDTDRGKRHVLRGINAVFHKGDSVGILGRNGAGKSTLMKIIGGVDFPTQGQVVRRMSVSWPLGFGGALHPRLTGADNSRFIARIYNRPADWVIGFVQEFAELGDYFRLPVHTYSAGMQTRLAFALSLAVDFDCYLVDEVVAVGDHRFAQRCREAMLERRGRSTLLLVSHQPDIIRSLCTSAATLHEGRLTFHEDLDQAVAHYHAL